MYEMQTGLDSWDVFIDIKFREKDEHYWSDKVVFLDKE